jgi:hypothetical protein
LSLCPHLRLQKQPLPQAQQPNSLISQIMKFVMSSAAKAELGALYTTAKEMFPLCQTLIKMGLLLMHGAYTHEACNSDPGYLVTWNLFTPLLGRKWTYVATVYSLSHQAMTRTSDQLHTTSFCSPPVSSNTRNTGDTRNALCFCSLPCKDHNLETYLS